MKNQKGITLIALVITIVVLIILAGVAINLTLGENGILRRAETAKENYNLAREKEALEIEIMEVQVEILETEGRNATLNDLLNKIDTSKYTIELHFEPLATTENVTSVPTYAIVNRINTMYYFTVDAKLVITDVELVEPTQKYIKFSEITWANGKASITLSTTEAGTIEYKIGEEGTYQEGTTIDNLNHTDVVYARINSNGQYTEEETKIIYDGVEPEEFTISVPEEEITFEELKITSTGTEDKQSGLKDYSFVVTKDGEVVKEIKNQTETEYTINELAAETQYVVYMLAYDKAGNVRKSNEVTVTTPAIPLARMFGQKVNYEANGETDWSIFYIEECNDEDYMYKDLYGNIYLITSDYLKYSNAPNSVPNWTVGVLDSDLARCTTSYKSLVTYNNELFMTKKYELNSSYRASKSASGLLNSETWSIFANGTSGGLNIENSSAIGSPTLEMWVASWNKAFPTEQITLGVNARGYSYDGEDSLTLTSSSALYFPYTGRSNNRWPTDYVLSSPVCRDGDTTDYNNGEVKSTGVLSGSNAYLRSSPSCMYSRRFI